MRYILIDNGTGYIAGDSADLGGAIFEGSPEEFAAALDARLGKHGRRYEMIGHNPRSTAPGYHVYRADVGGREVVPIVWDGQSRDEIEVVERDCEYLGFIYITREGE